MLHFRRKSNFFIFTSTKIWADCHFYDNFRKIWQQSYSEKSILVFQYGFVFIFGVLDWGSAKVLTNMRFCVNLTTHKPGTGTALCLNIGKLLGQQHVCQKNPKGKWNSGFLEDLPYDPFFFPNLISFSICSLLRLEKYVVPIFCLKKINGCPNWGSFFGDFFERIYC